MHWELFGSRGHNINFGAQVSIRDQGEKVVGVLFFFSDKAFKINTILGEEIFDKSKDI